MNAFACARRLFDGGSEAHARKQFVAASPLGLQAPSVQRNSLISPLRTALHRARAFEPARLKITVGLLFEGLPRGRSGCSDSILFTCLKLRLGKGCYRGKGARRKWRSEA